MWEPNTRLKTAAKVFLPALLAKVELSAHIHGKPRGCNTWPQANVFCFDRLPKRHSNPSVHLFHCWTASWFNASSLRRYVHFLQARHDLKRGMVQQTASGLFLPSSSTSTPLPEATVIAVGPGAPNKEGSIVPTTVKPGDRVLLPGWGGNSIKVGEDVSGSIWLWSSWANVVGCRNTSCSRTRRFLQKYKNDGVGKGHLAIH